MEFDVRHLLLYMFLAISNVAAESGIPLSECSVGESLWCPAGKPPTEGQQRNYIRVSYGTCWCLPDNCTGKNEAVAEETNHLSQEMTATMRSDGSTQNWQTSGATSDDEKAQGTATARNMPNEPNLIWAIAIIVSIVFCIIVSSLANGLWCQNKKLEDDISKLKAQISDLENKCQEHIKEKRRLEEVSIQSPTQSQDTDEDKQPGSQCLKLLDNTNNINTETSIMMKDRFWDETAATPFLLKDHGPSSNGLW